MERRGTVRTRLVQIGNSRGVRIPKPLLEQLGLKDEVELRAEEDALIIAPVRRTRASWSSAAKLLHERGEDGMLDEPTPTSFDESEWEWQ